MFIIVKRRGLNEKIVYENSDFNKCVATRQQKMVGANPSDEFVIYRKQDYAGAPNNTTHKKKKTYEYNRKR